MVFNLCCGGGRVLRGRLCVAGVAGCCGGGRVLREWLCAAGVAG